MRHLRLVTGVLTVALLGSLALPTSADQTFWNLSTGRAPQPPRSTDPAPAIGDIYYYGCGGYGGGGRRSGIAQQEQPRPYGFGFAPERNPAPPVFQAGYPQYPHTTLPVRNPGRNGSRPGMGFGQGCGGNFGYGGNGSGSNGYGRLPRVSPRNPGVPPRYYPQRRQPNTAPHPMHE